jgi:hypothetical protein
MPHRPTLGNGDDEQPRIDELRLRLRIVRAMQKRA